MSLGESKLLFTAGSQTIVAHHEYIKNTRHQHLLPLFGEGYNPASDRSASRSFYGRLVDGTYICFPTAVNPTTARWRVQSICSPPPEASTAAWWRVLFNCFPPLPTSVAAWKRVLWLPASNDFCCCLEKGTFQMRPATRGFYRNLEEDTIHLRPATYASRHQRLLQTPDGGYAYK